MDAVELPAVAVRSRVQEEKDDADEMPLLFMDSLPSDFQQNAQLAALVTFMGSDDDASDAKEEDEKETVTTGKHSGAQQRRKTRRTVRQPYARASQEATKHSALEDADENKTRKKKRSAMAAQELSLYLSMFSVSKE